MATPTETIRLRPRLRAEIERIARPLLLGDARAGGGLLLSALALGKRA